MLRSACDELVMTSWGGANAPKTLFSWGTEWKDLVESGILFGENGFSGLIKWVTPTTWGLVTESEG